MDKINGTVKNAKSISPLLRKLIYGNYPPF